MDTCESFFYVTRKIKSLVVQWHVNNALGEKTGNLNISQYNSIAFRSILEWYICVSSVTFVLSKTRSNNCLEKNVKNVKKRKVRLANHIYSVAQIASVSEFSHRYISRFYAIMGEWNRLTKPLSFTCHLISLLQVLIWVISSLICKTSHCCKGVLPHSYSWPDIEGIRLLR